MGKCHLHIAMKKQRSTHFWIDLLTQSLITKIMRFRFVPLESQSVQQCKQYRLPVRHGISR